MRNPIHFSYILPCLVGAVAFLAVSGASLSQSGEDDSTDAEGEGVIPFALPQAGPFSPAEIEIENSQAIADWFRSAHADAAAEAARIQQLHANQMMALQQRLEAQMSQSKKANEHAWQQTVRQEAYEESHAIDESALPVLQRPLGEQYAKQSQMLFLLRGWNSRASSALVLFFVYRSFFIVPSCSRGYKNKFIC